MPDNSFTPIPILPQTIRDAYGNQGKRMNFGLRVAKDIQYGKNKNGKPTFNLWRESAGGKAAIGIPLPDYAAMGIDFGLLRSRTRSLAKAYPLSATVALELSSRLVIGMGHASVYETGITLHPVYGLPYLPASSLKGVVRRRYIEEHYGDDEAAALGDQDFCDLFGCTGTTRITVDEETKDVDSYYRKDGNTGDRRGGLIFFDAFPTKAPRIEIDIVNPHYNPYYEKALPPADIYNPVPVNFLTVAPGVRFELAFAIDATYLGERSYDVAPIRQLLIDTLTEDGMGGKTTVGYGRFFDPVEEEERKLKMKEEKAAKEAEMKRAEAGITTASTDDYVSLEDLKQRRGAYRVAVKVVEALPRSRFIFEPLVEELKGRQSQPIFVNLKLQEGDRLDDVEITGVNLKKGHFKITQNTVRK
jgi:CRISPR type III-B/RAMP module RAMP protein Cmr6